MTHTVISGQWRYIELEIEKLVFTINIADIGLILKQITNWTLIKAIRGRGRLFGVI